MQPVVGDGEGCDGDAEDSNENLAAAATLSLGRASLKELQLVGPSNIEFLQGGRHDLGAIGAMGRDGRQVVSGSHATLRSVVVSRRGKCRKMIV